jgi:Uma2 family endonuclease
MLVILRRCAGCAYRVGTEWDCDLSEQLGTKTLLVPDVCAIKADRLARLSQARRECPPFGPDIVVEVRSPNDRTDEREWKVRAYLEAGTLLVLDVMPDQRTIDAIALDQVTMFREGDTFHHEGAPWLHFDVAEAFADLL